MKNVIAIFGVPRSGTSWTGQIFNSSPHVAYRFQPLFAYEFKNQIDSRSSRREIDRFHADMMQAKSDFVLQTTNVSGHKGMDFQKYDVDTLVWKSVRHMNVLENLAKKSATKLLLVVRHPGGVINSWLRAPKEFDPSWDPIKEWRKAKKKNQGEDENYFGYDKWKEAVELFNDLKRKHAKQVFILRYEDLARDGLGKTEEMFDFAGLPLEDQTKEFLAESTSYDDQDPYGVFRSDPDPDRWEQELDKRIKDELLKDLANFHPAREIGY